MRIFFLVDMIIWNVSERKLVKIASPMSDLLHVLLSLAEDLFLLEN